MSYLINEKVQQLLKQVEQAIANKLEKPFSLNDLGNRRGGCYEDSSLFRQLKFGIYVFCDGDKVDEIGKKVKVVTSAEIEISELSLDPEYLTRKNYEKFFDLNYGVFLATTQGSLPEKT